MDVEQVDIESLLDNYGVEYKLGGKNVSVGWIGVNCPFCSDTSFHLGISKTRMYSCWRCGEKGGIIKLFKVLLDKNYEEVKSILQEYEYFDEEENKKEKKRTLKKDVKFPYGATKSIPNLANDYLLRRGFLPTKIRAKYKLLFCDEYCDWDYKNRIIIPVYENGNLVSYTSRDYSGKSNLSYRHHKDTMVGKPYVYNIDSLKENAIIFEGPTEVWRFGDGTICTFGVKYSKLQVLKIASLGLKRAIIAYDNEYEAQEMAKKLAYEIGPYVDESVKIIEYYDGKNKDPDGIFKSLSEKEIEEEKRKIFEM